MGILNVATYVTVNGQYVNVLEMNQYQNKIRFLQLTGTSGTLTSQEINTLRSDNTNYIIVDNELYNCNDLQDANGYLVYTHTGADASNNVNIKTLSITLTNNNWSIQTTPVQPKIPVANTNEAVQFAEDERQKSKNLLNIYNASSYTTNGVTLTIENNIITLNGTTTGFTTFYRPHQLIRANVGKYAFSFKYISGTISGNSGYQSLYNQVGKNEMYYPNTSIINDITSPTDYNELRVAISANITFDNFKYSLQYEQGDVATSYQPYHGQITHNGDAPVVFAESEREKSKNLFDYTNAYGYSACSSNNDGSFNISIENFYYAEIRYKLKMKVGQPYSFSAYINNFTSSSSSQVNYSARFMYTDGTGDEAQTQAIIGQRVSFTLTPAKEVDYILFRLLRTGEKVNMSGVVSNIQIEEGSVATDYQPYNGAIVHEKQLPKITTLWTNPNPSNDFSSQTITLANDNYDYAIMICVSRTNELDIQISFFFEKGNVPLLNYVLTNEDSEYAIEAMSRRVYHTNNTTLNVQNCYYTQKTNNAIVGNNLLIPVKVIGIKIGE